MDKEQLKDLLEKDRLEELFEALEQAGKKANKESFLNDLALLSARFHDNKKQWLLKTKSVDTYEVELNQIRKGLAEMIKYLHEPPQAFPKRAASLLFQWRLPLLVLFVSLALVCIGLLPADHTSFSATIITEDLRFRLAADAPAIPLVFEAKRCELYPLREIRGAGWHQSADDQEEQMLDIALDSDRLEIELLFEPAARFGLRKRQGDITLVLPEDGQSGQINAYGSRLQMKHSGEIRICANPELLEWTSEPNAELNFSLFADSAFSLTGVPIQAVEFIQKDLHADSPKSALKSGHLNIGHSEPIRLSPPDFFELDGLSLTFLSVKPIGPSFEVELKGNAKDIRSGYLQMKSHKLTLLESFYQNQKLSFFASVFVSLISFLWAFMGAIAQSKKN